MKTHQVGPMFAMLALIENWFPGHKNVRYMPDGGFAFEMDRAQ